MTTASHTRNVQDGGSSKTHKGRAHAPLVHPGCGRRDASAVGNLQVLHALGLRPKLTVSSPRDPEEQEADRAADAFARGADRVAVDPGHAPRLARKCAQCACADEDEHLARKPDAASGPSGGRLARVSSALHDGAGTPLPADTRRTYERFFGADLDAVRIHAGNQANLAARALSAQAFTRGADIYFAQDRFDPDSGEGRRLLAHELAHTLQQAPAAKLYRQDGPDAGTEGSGPGGDPLDAGAEHSGTSSEALDPDAGPQPAPPAETREDTLGEIRRINRYDWVAPWDESRLERLWDSFGSALPQVATDNWGEWQSSIDGGAELWSIPSAQAVESRFRSAIVAQAQAYLADNRALAEREKNAIGADPGTAPTRQQSDEVRDRREAAQRIVDADRAMAALRMTLVGYEHVPGRYALFDSRCHPIANEPGNRDLATKPFDPRARPQIDPRGDECHPMPSWELANAMWERLQAIVAGETQRYPTLYALVRNFRERDVATERGQDDAAAGDSRRVMLEALNDLLGNIDATEPRLQGNLPLELFPIHQQLFARPPWNAGFEGHAAHALVDDYQSAEFWRSMGLGALSAALFIVASLATGGLAAVLFGAAAGISVGTAANSWEHFNELRQAAGTHLSDTTALVTGGQANAALFTAVLDTVFAFLDAYAAARGVAGAARLARGGAAATEQAAPGTLRQALEAEARATTESVAEIGTREGPRLTEALRGGAAREVTDEALRREGYVLEVELMVDGERHVYRQLENGSWCRFSARVCGFSFPGSVAQLAEDARRALENPAAAATVREVAESTGHAMPRFIPASRIAEIQSRLLGRFPIVSRLRPGAIERVVRAAHAAEGGGLRRALRWPSAARGQLLEEVAAARIEGLLETGAGREALGLGQVGERMVFIGGHRIRDAAGAMLTDGVIAVQRGDRLEIVAVLESKAGSFAAGGLTESLGGLRRAGTSEIVEAIRDLSGRGDRGLMARIASIDPALARTMRSATPDAVERDALMAALQRLSDAELRTVREAVMHGEGQVSRDIERLMSGEDRTVSLLIDNRPITASLPRRPSFLGAVPSDVATADIAAELARGHFDYRTLDMGADAMSRDGLDRLARALVEALGEDLQRGASAAAP